MFKNILAIGFLMGAICIMLNLGFWQLDRLAWKNDILAKIEKFESVDATKTPLDLSNIEDFQRGYIDGYFQSLPLLTIAPRTYDGQVGYHVIGLFRTSGGKNILVNMGWVADHENPILPEFLPGRAIGYLQYPDTRNRFTPINNPTQNRWYWIDHDTIKSHLNIDELEAFMLYNEYDFGNIKSFNTMQKPRNKHAQYAAFWFGMSGLLLLLSCLYFWRSRQVS